MKTISRAKQKEQGVLQLQSGWYGAIDHGLKLPERHVCEVFYLLVNAVGIEEAAMGADSIEVQPQHLIGKHPDAWRSVFEGNSRSR